MRVKANAVVTEAVELAVVAAIVVAELGWVDDLVPVSVGSAVELADVV